jgi:hypothetical protein
MTNDGRLDDASDDREPVARRGVEWFEKECV